MSIFLCFQYSKCTIPTYVKWVCWVYHPQTITYRAWIRRATTWRYKDFKNTNCVVKFEAFTRKFDAKDYHKDLNTAIVAAMTFQETVQHLILQFECCNGQQRRKEWLAEIELTPGTSIKKSIDRIKKAACSGCIKSVEESIQKAAAEATQSACGGTHFMQEGRFSMQSQKPSRR